MPRASKERTEARRDEIMEACIKLYETHNFSEINLKEISTVTSFSRPTIYNYFQTKEEIFLAIFQREYDLWTAALNEIADDESADDREEVADRMADALEERQLMLRILAANLYDIEENSRLERLVSFKTSYLASVEAMDRVLENCCPQQNSAERRLTLLTVHQFLHGVYPYAHATDKQKEAMDEVGITYGDNSLHELVYEGLVRIMA